MFFIACEAGFYGEKCCSECGHCGQNGTCHHVNGKCLQDCKSGYQPPFCKEGMFIILETVLGSRSTSQVLILTEKYLFTVFII